MQVYHHLGGGEEGNRNCSYKKQTSNRGFSADNYIYYETKESSIPECIFY